MAISDFTDMMPHTVTYAPVVSQDKYGARTYGTPVSYSARVIYKEQLVRASNGAEVIAKGVVWFLGSPIISTEGQIVLPDSTTPVIITSETLPDEDGAHHTKVFFGSS